MNARRKLSGFVVNLLDCDIAVRGFEFPVSNKFHFRIMSLENVWTKGDIPLSSLSKPQQELTIVRSLRNSKTLSVSAILLCVLAVRNNPVVWRVSILLLIFNSSSPLSKPLDTIPSVRTKIDITIILMFNNLLSSQATSNNFFNPFT